MLGTMRPCSLEGHRPLVSAATGEAFSRSLVLTELAPVPGAFVHHDVIPPGHRASRTHAHSHVHELVLVLAGEVVAVVGDRRIALREGQYLALPPGLEHAHHVENVGTTEASILVIASAHPDDRVTNVDVDLSTPRP